MPDSSNSSAFYSLKVTNGTAIDAVITGVSGVLSGNFLNADIDLIRFDFQTVLSGTLSPFSYGQSLTGDSPLAFAKLSGILPIDSTVPAGEIRYVTFGVGTAGSATPGRTFTMDCATSPIVLTITGSPDQIDLQTDIAGTVTVT